MKYPWELVEALQAVHLLIMVILYTMKLMEDFGWGTVVYSLYWCLTDSSDCEPYLYI